MSLPFVGYYFDPNTKDKEVGGRLNLANATVAQMRKLITKVAKSQLGTNSCMREMKATELRRCVVESMADRGILEDSPALQQYLGGPRPPVQRPPSPVDAPAPVTGRVQRQPPARPPLPANLPPAPARRPSMSGSTDEPRLTVEVTLEELANERGVRNGPSDFKGVRTDTLKNILRRAEAKGEGFCGPRPEDPQCKSNEVCDVRSSLCLPRNEAEGIPGQYRNLQIREINGRRILGTKTALDRLAPVSARRTAMVPAAAPAPAPAQAPARRVSCREPESTEERNFMEIVALNMADPAAIDYKLLIKAKNMGLCLTGEILQSIVSNQTTKVKDGYRVPLYILRGAKKLGFPDYKGILGPILASMAQNAGNTDIVEFFAKKGIEPMSDESDIESDVIEPDSDEEGEVAMAITEAQRPVTERVPSPGPIPPPLPPRPASPAAPPLPPRPASPAAPPLPPRPASPAAPPLPPRPASPAVSPFTRVEPSEGVPESKVEEQEEEIVSPRPASPREQADSPPRPRQLISDIQLEEALSEDDIEKLRQYRECLRLP